MLIFSLKTFKKLFLLSALIFCFFAFLPSAFAATYYWVGASGANMNVGSSWSTTINSACLANAGAVVPGPNDNVIFESTCTNNATMGYNASNNSTSTLGFVVNSFNMQSSYTGTVTMAASLIATSSSVTITAGTLVLSGYGILANTLTIGTNGTLKLRGDEGLSIASTITNSGTVEYVGNGDGLANTYWLKNIPYYNLKVNFTDKVDNLTNTLSTLSTNLSNYWKLDDTVTPAVDSVGGNNGTWSGALTSSTSIPLSTITSSWNTRSLSFTGVTSQYVTLGTAPLNATTFSIAGWMYPNSGLITNGGNLLTKYVGGGNILNFRYYNSSISGLGFTIDDGTTAILAPAGLVSAGKWYHATITHTNGGTDYLYLNGVLVQTKANNGTWVYNSTYNTRLGVRDSNGTLTTPFNGLLDDMRIYNSKALSPAEVSFLAAGYTNNSVSTTSLGVAGNFTLSGGIFTAPTTMTISGNYTQNSNTSNSVFIASTTLNVAGNFAQTDGAFVRNQSTLNLTGGNGSTQSLNSTTTASLSSSLVNYWKFNETNGSTAVDSAGSSNGTWTNSPVSTTSIPLSTVTSSWDTRAINFTSASSQYIGAGTAPLNNTSFTLSAWINLSSIASSSAIFSKRNASGQPVVLQYIASTGLSFTTDDGNTSIVSPANAISAGQWYHVAVTHVNSGTDYMYINGIPVASGALTALTYSASYNFRIGTRENAGGALTNYFNGSIDDARIYSRALSPAEIAILAQGDITSAGGNTFYKLSANDSASSTIQFTAGNTVSVFSTTTLKSTTGGQLSLLSTTPGTQWKFDPQGGLDLAYLTVKDSNNVNASTTNVNGNINANNYSGMVDGGNNTNWTFTLPLITLAATGTQVTTTPLPVTNEYMGGAFYATKNTGTSTVTSIKISQYGNLPTSYISNVQLLYATSTNSMCATTSPITNAGAVEFGHRLTWDTSTSTTITGSMSVGATIMCVYVRFSLTGTLTLTELGESIDLEITNPSTDVISSGVTVSPSTNVNVQTRTVQTLIDGTPMVVPIVTFSSSASSISSGASTTLSWSVTNGPTSCIASGDWSGSKSITSGTESTGNITTSKAYTLTCTNSYGSASASVAVSIINPST